MKALSFHLISCEISSNLNPPNEAERLSVEALNLALLLKKHSYPIFETSFFKPKHERNPA